MTNLTDVPVIRCVILGDNESGKTCMMRRYADMSGMPFCDQLGEMATAFNGQKCLFVDPDAIAHGENQTTRQPHVFLLCVSVARQDSVEQTVRMVMDTVTSQIGTVPFVLVGTQIDKRTAVPAEGADRSLLPMALSQAETFAKRIGASKYLECSAATGEGLDEVFEDAFAIGQKYAVEQKRFIQRKKSSLDETNGRKQSCITQ